MGTNPGLLLLLLILSHLLIEFDLHLLILILHVFKFGLEGLQLHVRFHELLVDLSGVFLASLFFLDKILDLLITLLLFLDEYSVLLL